MKKNNHMDRDRHTCGTKNGRAKIRETDGDRNDRQKKEMRITQAKGGRKQARMGRKERRE